MQQRTIPLLAQNENHFNTLFHNNDNDHNDDDFYDYLLYLNNHSDVNFIDFLSLFVRVPKPFNLFSFDLYTVIKCDGFVGTTTQFQNR